MLNAIKRFVRDLCYEQHDNFLFCKLLVFSQVTSETDVKSLTLNLGISLFSKQMLKGKEGTFM